MGDVSLYSKAECGRYTPGKGKTLGEGLDIKNMYQLHNIGGN